MSMKNRLPTNISLFLIALLLTCLVIEWQFKVIRRMYDNFVLDNWNHYLSCQDLPTKLEVEKTVEEHQDVIQQIEQMAPGFVGVEINSLTCEGKADLIFWYGTHEQRIAIEEIISDDTFFGIPYRLQNR